MEPSYTLAGRQIGADHRPYLVAELSGNHQQSIDKAKAIIEAAARSGADAVKLQTYTPDTITLPFDNPWFRIEEGPWAGRTLHDLYGEAMTPWEWHPELSRFAEKCGLALFSAPFDETAVDFLEGELDVPFYKIASFELNHLPLLRKVAQTRKPVVLSTGMASQQEIRTALKTLTEAGASQVILLKCISAYPADPENFNLRSMVALKETYGCLTGLSDHTLSHEVCLGAVALGACVIEKHLTLSRAEGGVDCSFSLEPQEFGEMVESVKKLHAALGQPKIGPCEQEHRESRFRRSIFVSAPIAQGEYFTTDNIKIVRPADGLDPAQWESVLGKKAACDLDPGQPLRKADVALD